MDRQIHRYLHMHACIHTYIHTHTSSSGHILLLAMKAKPLMSGTRQLQVTFLRPVLSRSKGMSNNGLVSEVLGHEFTWFWSPGKSPKPPSMGSFWRSWALHLVGFEPSGSPLSLRALPVPPLPANSGLRVSTLGPKPGEGTASSLSIFGDPSFMVV